MLINVAVGPMRGVGFTRMEYPIVGLSATKIGSRSAYEVDVPNVGHLLVSYRQPVALRTFDGKEYVTDEKCSCTTSKQISTWRESRLHPSVKPRAAQLREYDGTKPQAWFWDVARKLYYGEQVVIEDTMV